MPNYGGTLSSLERKGIIPLRTSHFEVKKRILEIISVAEILAYSAVFSYLTVLKFQAFGIYAWDLGFYHQAFHTTVASGDLFFITVEWSYTQTAVPKGAIRNRTK